MQIKTYNLRWLLPVTVLWLLTGCQSRSVIPTNVCPQVPMKPSLNMERPATSYSKQWQTVVEQSQQQLMDTQLMQND